MLLDCSESDPSSRSDPVLIAAVSDIVPCCYYWEVLGVTVCTSAPAQSVGVLLFQQHAQHAASWQWDEACCGGLWQSICKHSSSA